MKETRPLEKTAVDRYPELIRTLGSECAALEIICGLYLAGDMRPVFMECVFGREILMTAAELSDVGEDRWKDAYPSLWHAAEYLRTGKQMRRNEL